MKHLREFVHLLGIALLLLLTYTLSAQETSGSRQEPSLAIARNPVKLAKFLTRNDTSQKQMAYHLYEWITHNITYDVRAYSRKKQKYYSAKRTLKRKRGICYQYAELYETLCRNVGISAHSISGYSKGASYFEGDILYEADHAWNGVRLDSAWYLVDVTWGSGTLAQKNRWFRKFLKKWFGKPYINDRYKFLHRPTDQYFMTDPERLIVDHLPMDSSWQLLDYIVSLKDFESGNSYRSMVASSTRKVDPLKYDEWLGQYEFLSKLQFEQKTAEAGFAFNKRNSILLGFSAYNRAVSLQRRYADSGVENELVQVEELLKNSVAHLNRHKKQANQASSNTRIKAKRVVSKSLRQPYNRRAKGVSGSLMSTQKQIDKNRFGRRISKLKTTRQRLNDQLINQKREIKVPDPSRQKKPELVKINLEKLQGYAGRIEHDPDSLDQLFSELKHVADQRSRLLRELVKGHRALAPLIVDASNSIQNDLGFKEITNKMRRIDQKGADLDSLSKALKSQVKQTSKLILQTNQTLATLKSDYQQAMQMIVQNRQFSEAETFDRQQYLRFDQAIGRLKLYRIKLVQYSIDLLNHEVGYYQQLNDNLKRNQKALAVNWNFIKLFEDKWLASIQSKKARSYYQCNRIIRLAKNRLSKLP